MTKISRWLWIPVAVFGSLVVLRCGCQKAEESLTLAIAARFPHVQWVDAETLSEWLDRRPQERPLLLDVRTRAEFDVSHLRDAHHADPDELSIESLHIPPNATVVVYCSVGYRSGAFIEQIQRAGIRNVYNLEGGIFEWANDGRPVYRDGKPTELVHPYDWLWSRLLRAELRAPAPLR